MPNPFPSPADRRRAYRRALADLATVLGTSDEGAEEFVGTLPYSCIPGPSDGRLVVEWLLANGWTPPERNNL